MRPKFESRPALADSDAMPDPLPPTDRFMTELRSLDKLYCPLRTRRNLSQIFLLQVHHAQLNQYASFLDRFEAEYVGPRMRDFSGSQSKLHEWSLKAISTDSCLYRKLLVAASELVLASESLLDVVVAAEDQAEGSKGPDLAMLAAELRWCFKDLMGRLQRTCDDLEQQLARLSRSREMSQSRNVQILTLLATVFLPLSLSAGVLSMQTRFKDLGDLLYDFFGVVVLFVAAVLLLLFGILVLSLVGELEAMLRHWEAYRELGWVYRAAAAFFSLVVGALILSSFCVGMFKDVSLGAKILGYGIAAVAGWLCIASAIGLISYFGWRTGYLQRVVRILEAWDRKSSGGKKRENDPESNAGQKRPGSQTQGEESARKRESLSRQEVDS